MTSLLPPSQVTLGILAGGRGSRLGGTDKAWLQRGGVPQVRRLAARLANDAGAVLVSANRALERHAACGLTAVPDRVPDAGPLGGLDALARVCGSDWLLTIPVDLVSVNDCLLPSLAGTAAAAGAYAVDDDGVQPLVALWRVEALRPAAADAIASGDLAVQALQRRLEMAPVRLAGVRFGNLNLPEDLAAAGFDPA